MWKRMCAALALGLVVAAALPARADSAYSVLDTFPVGEGLHVEAAVLVRDARAMGAWMREQQVVLRRTKLGKAYFSPEVQRGVLGFDVQGELETLVALAAPSGSAVPAGLAVFSYPGGIAAQLLIKVEPGFAERAVAHSAATSPWRASMDGDVLRFAWGEQLALGRVEPSGWLRVATEGDALAIAGAPTKLFDERLSRWLQGTDFVFALRGGGMLSSLLGMASGDTNAGDWLGRARTFAVTMELGAQQTVRSRVLVDSPDFAPLAAAFRRPDLGDRMSALWHADAVAMASLALPPQVLAMGLQSAQAVVVDTPYAIPDEVLRTLEKLEGRVGFVDFGSPSDWALAFELVDEASASRFAASLNTWLSGLMQAAAIDPAGMLVMESFPGAPAPLLHVRPDEVLDGLRVLNVGSTALLVRQRARVAQMLGGAPGAAVQSKRLLEGPITPLMKAHLARPAMLQGYMLATGDGSFTDWLVWPAKGLELAAKKLGALDPSLGGGLLAAGNPAESLHRLPLAAAIAGYQWMLVYDLAASLDLDGSVLVFELASSQL